MSRRSLVVVLVLVAGSLGGCTEPNKAYCADDRPCTDPSLPFCDLDGVVGGIPNSCIAVSCTPGEFAACDGDRAIQCNTAGNNYDTVVCERGCDAASDGCRLCNPNETACVNGMTVTCDASGMVASMQSCPLGCFESEPRCRDVDPSNELGAYLDMTLSAPELDAPQTIILNTETGVISDPTIGLLPTVPSFLIPAPPGGVRMRVFVVRSARLLDVLVVGDPNIQLVPPAFALVSAGDIVIAGNLDIGADWYRQYSEARYGAGSITTGACVGDPGGYYREPGPIHFVAGAGGGGNATAGSPGGGTPNYYDGGAGGAAFGNETLVPLTGGCAGGGLINDWAGTETWPYTGSGGGAVHMVSRTRIALTTDATISANGAGGYGILDGGAGGGSGGGILLEAPIVEIASGAALTANGGGGSSGDMISNVANGSDGLRSTDRAPGGPINTGGCTSPSQCGVPGAGGALIGPPTSGANLVYSTATGNHRLGGGGAGAVGRIRINTRDATYVKASDVIESPAVSTGGLATR